MTPISYKNTVDGLSLHGTVTEVENPKAVLSIIHGFGEHGGRYKLMADDLAAQGIATLTIDLHGHGQTEGKRGVVADYELLREDAAILLAEAQRRYPNVPQFLYGHSMGGGLVINYALNRSAESLSGIIASAPLLLLPKPVSPVTLSVGNFISKFLPNMAIPQPINPVEVSTLKDVQEAYVGDPLNHGRIGLKLAHSIIGQGKDNLARASEFTKPLLLMHARGDKLTSFEASETFSKSAANCEFVPYDNAEHEIHNDTCRDDVFGQIKSFIESHI